jgi:hypothetical protein
MKKNKKKDEFLEQLKKVPIVLVACEKSALSRNTVYRWRKEDNEFSVAMDQALKEGEELVNDMTESQLLSMIKDKEWSAISFWLRHRNPKFRDKVELVGNINHTTRELTSEDEELLKESLRLALPTNHKQNDEPKS